jgi:peptidylprolyl isomerase
MKTLVRIDDETITESDFLGYLKLSNQYPHLMERMIRRKVLVHAARRRRLSAGPEEIQRAADDFRRCMGLHRALDSRRWMSQSNLTADDFEGFIVEHVLVAKLVDLLVAPENIEDYFRRNRPRFESVDLAHIVMEDEVAAGEIAALVRDAPDQFEALARRYSLDADTRDSGGRIAELRRGSLPEEIEERVFAADPGDILGPFPLHDSDVYEIIRVDARRPPVLDDATRERIAELIQEEWLARQIREHSVGFSPATNVTCDFSAAGEG